VLRQEAPFEAKKKKKNQGPYLMHWNVKDCAFITRREVGQDLGESSGKLMLRCSIVLRKRSVH